MELCKIPNKDKYRQEKSKRHVMERIREMNDKEKERKKRLFWHLKGNFNGKNRKNCFWPIKSSIKNNDEQKKTGCHLQM